MSALWRKKFKKQGRTISLSLNEYLNNKDNHGFIHNYSEFYNDQNLLDSSYNLDQKKINKSNSNSFTGKLTYTEPLTKFLSLVVNYGADIQNTASDILSYNKDLNGDYNIIDSTYSNHYIYNQFTNSGGVSFVYNKKKINFNFGTDAGATQYRQKNTFISPQQTLNRNFVNWKPNASFQYKFSQQNSFRIRYNGQTQQPSISQIQPVANNTDNLNIYIGNANLKPYFTHSLSASFNHYNALSNLGFFVYGNYYATVNPIVGDISTNDTTGQSIISYFNLNNSSISNYYVGAGYYQPWKKIGVNYEFRFFMNGSKQASLINDVANYTQSNTYQVSAAIYKYKEKKIDINLNATGGYTKSTSTLQNQINNNYWSIDAGHNVTVYLPQKFQIETDGHYTWQQKTQTFAEHSQYIWNAWIGRTFLKKDGLLVKFSANDILNQNVGYNRTPMDRGFQLNAHTTIKRYFMFSVVWDFSKMGNGGETKK